MTSTSTTATQLTPSESVQMLTGYDEQKIKSRFGADVVDLDGAWFLRALDFGNLLHSGLDEEQAFAKTMAKTLTDLKASFAPDEGDDVDPGDPDTAAGKDSSQPG